MHRQQDRRRITGPKKGIKMKKIIIPACVLLTLLGWSSCAVVGGIFKAGAAVGIIAVIIVIVAIIWIVSLFRGKS